MHVERRLLADCGSAALSRQLIGSIPLPTKEDICLFQEPASQSHWLLDLWRPWRTPKAHVALRFELSMTSSDKP